MSGYGRSEESRGGGGGGGYDRGYDDRSRGYDERSGGGGGGYDDRRGGGGGFDERRSDDRYEIPPDRENKKLILFFSRDDRGYDDRGRDRGYDDRRNDGPRRDDNENPRNPPTGRLTPRTYVYKFKWKILSKVNF